MFVITITTNCGYKKDFRVIEPDYMLFYFKSLIQAVDAHHVLVIDGLTGEVCWEWKDGKYLVANGAVL